MSGPIGHTIYALVPLAGETNPGGLRRLAEGILERAAEVLTVPLRVGIGSVVAHLRDVPRSRADADQAVRVLARIGGESSLASIDDVRAQATMLELGDLVKERPHLLVGKIALLRRLDDEHGTNYVETITAYLDAVGDIPKAAQLVDTHPNTFRYRLRRLCEEANLDLANPEQRLAAELELRLR